MRGKRRKAAAAIKGRRYSAPTQIPTAGGGLPRRSKDRREGLGFGRRAAETEEGRLSRGIVEIREVDAGGGYWEGIGYWACNKSTP